MYKKQMLLTLVMHLYILGYSQGEIQVFQGITSNTAYPEIHTMYFYGNNKCHYSIASPNWTCVYNNKVQYTDTSVILFGLPYSWYIDTVIESSDAEVSGIMVEIYVSNPMDWDDTLFTVSLQSCPLGSVYYGITQKAFCDWDSGIVIGNQCAYRPFVACCNDTMTFSFKDAAKVCFSRIQCDEFVLDCVGLHIARSYRIKMPSANKFQIHIERNRCITSGPPRVEYLWEGGSSLYSPKLNLMYERKFDIDTNTFFPNK